jgi:outer membrane protein assembly factor BamB
MGGPDAVWGLDVLSGAVRWHWGSPSGKMFGSSPTIKDGTLYIGGEDGYLYALKVPYT